MHDPLHLEKPWDKTWCPFSGAFSASRQYFVHSKSLDQFSGISVCTIFTIFRRNGQLPASHSGKQAAPAQFSFSTCRMLLSTDGDIHMWMMRLSFSLFFLFPLVFCGEKQGCSLMRSSRRVTLTAGIASFKCCILFFFYIAGWSLLLGWQCSKESGQSLEYGVQSTEHATQPLLNVAQIDFYLHLGGEC